MLTDGQLLLITLLGLLILPYETAILIKFRTITRKIHEKHMVHNINRLVTELEKIEDKKRK